MSQEFEQIITRFGKTIGIPDLKLTDGYCCLIFDEVVVNIEERGDSAFFYTTIGELPAEGRAAVCEMLLNANYLYRETQGCTLGADVKSGVIVVAYQTPVAVLTDPRFERLVENFIQVAETWTRKIAAAAQNAPADPARNGSAFSPNAGIRA